ncbi:MAG: SdrD B-like domain-containing protein [Kiritimatiellia bacterium]
MSFRICLAAAVCTAAPAVLFAQGVTVSGTKTLDLTGNGFSVDDPPAPGFTIELYRDTGDGVFDAGTDSLQGSTSTAAGTGVWRFDGLADGRYFVREALSPGWNQTGGPAFYTLDVINGVAHVQTGVVIDDFNGPVPASSYVINAIDPDPTLRQHTVPGVLGGQRDMLVDVNGAPSPISANGLVGGTAGSYSFASAGAPGSRVTLQYDGIDADPPGALVNQLGLASDLSAGGLNTHLRMRFLRLDAGRPGVTNMQMVVSFTSAAGSASYTGLVSEDPVGNPFLHLVPLGAFTTAGAFDLSAVTSATVEFNDPSQEDVDFEVDFIDLVRIGATGLPFANSAIPSCLSGHVYHDASDDGVLDPGESPIPNVEVRLAGTNDLGQVVARTGFTDGSGFFEFCSLRPGTYRLDEIQPPAWLDGRDTIGTPGGVTGPDRHTGILLPPGYNGVNNNFGELLSADLSLVKEGPAGTVPAGQTYSYRLEVTNLGPSAAQDVVITDPLPPEVAFVSSSSGCTPQPGNLLSCALGGLAAGASTSVTVTVRLACCLPPAVTNTAAVASATPDSDPNNNQASAVTLVATDLLPPVITCPPPQDLGCNPAALPAPDPRLVTAVDSCGTAVVPHVGDSTANLGCQVIVTRTYRATDACGNASTCTQTLTYKQDTTPPVFTAVPATLFAPCDNLPPVPAVTASDNCDAGPIAVQFGTETTPGNCSGNYTITRTWTATDACGNPGRLVQTVVVTDTTPPVIACPPPVDLGCNPAALPAPDPARVTASDACGTVLVTHQGDAPSVLGCQVTVTRTYRATDACGNASTCTQLITYKQDTAPPTFTAIPATVFAPCDNLPPVPAVTAGDNCDVGPIAVQFATETTPGNCPGSYTITRTWTATDACGNPGRLVQTVRVTDTTPPVITCPANSIAPGGCDSPPTVPDLRPLAVASDTCGTATVTQSPPPGTPFGGSVTVTLTATDACLNTASCSTRVDQVARLGNRIWYDLDHNGVQDNGETGVAGVRIELVDNNNQAVDSTTTDGTGLYQFCVTPGTYGVRVVAATLPPGYRLTLLNQTTVDLDSSADPLTGLTEKVTLQPGDNNPTLDAGVYLPVCLGDTVWIDVERDQNTAGDNLDTLGVPNVRLNLYRVVNGVQTFVTSTLTAPIAGNRGAYCFQDLVPGDYCVRIDLATIPAGYELTTGDSCCVNIVAGQPHDTCDFGVIDPSTAIDLTSFTATPVAGGVRIDWSTGSETGNLGFQITRSVTLNGARTPVNEWLVEGRGTGAGSSYTLLDAMVQDGPAFYWLEDFDVDGGSTVHGPVRVRVNLPAQAAPVAPRAGALLLPCAAPAAMTVRAGGAELPSAALDGALLVVAPSAGPLAVVPSDRPLRMDAASAAPVEGEPLQVEEMTGAFASWTVRDGVRALLIRHGASPVEIVDVTRPGAPVLLRGVAVRIEGESAVYLEARPGATRRRSAGRSRPAYAVATA